MLLRQIFDPDLAQYAYLVGCQATGEALVIDPERDVDRYVELAEREGLRLTAAAETHIHADFVSGARELAERYGATVYISAEGGDDWSYDWPDTSDNIVLLRDGDVFHVGNIELRALHSPGHTPEHLSFIVTDRGGGADEPIGIATGDFVFVGDLGRPDLLETAAKQDRSAEPSARRLFESVDRFLDFSDHIQVWPAHGAGSACGKALGAVPISTVGYERRHNAAIDASRRGEDAFVDAILDGQPAPPLYFATMKRLNKVGPPVLGPIRELVDSLPRLDAGQLLDALDSGVALLDTRTDRREFISRHLDGALHAPLDRSFPTVAGSVLEPPTDDDARDIVLLVDPQDAEDDDPDAAFDEAVERATRLLVRIGFDRIRGVAPIELLSDPLLADHIRHTPSADFDDVEARRSDDDVTVLDVRGEPEHESVHVPGSLNIPHTRLLDRLDEVPRDGRLFVHCKSGARAAVATALLEREGFDATWVDDSIDRWSSAHGS